MITAKEAAQISSSPDVLMAILSNSIREEAHKGKRKIVVPSTYINGITDKLKKAGYTIEARGYEEGVGNVHSISW